MKTTSNPQQATKQECLFAQPLTQTRSDYLDGLCMSIAIVVGLEHPSIYLFTVLVFQNIFFPLNFQWHEILIKDILFYSMKFVYKNLTSFHLYRFVVSNQLMSRLNLKSIYCKALSFSFHRTHNKILHEGPGI